MTENVIATEYLRLGCEVSLASEYLAAGNFGAGWCLLVNGTNRALQLCQAGVPGAASLYAAWNCALRTRTGSYSYLVTANDEVRYYPPGFLPW
jgi:hypothetical protein